MVNWKAIGITSLIFNILFVLFFILAWNIGSEMEEQEFECAMNVCSEYNIYWYDDYMEVCTCYDDNQVQVKTEYIG